MPRLTDSVWEQLNIRAPFEAGWVGGPKRSPAFFVRKISFTRSAYDAAGQTTLETQNIAGNPLGVRSLNPSYDGDGLRTALPYPSGKAVAASYPARGPVAGLTFHGQNVATQT